MIRIFNSFEVQFIRMIVSDFFFIISLLILKIENDYMYYIDFIIRTEIILKYNYDIFKKKSHNFLTCIRF